MVSEIEKIQQDHDFDTYAIKIGKKLHKEARMKISEFLQENSDMARAMFVSSSKEKLCDIKSRIMEVTIMLDHLELKPINRVMLLNRLMSYGKEADRLENIIKYSSYKKSNDSIDERMIVRAKEHDLSNLLDINKAGMALCLWHDDTKPSMSCKNNHAYCFTCGSHGDAIDVYMKIHNCSFSEAVKSLQ